MEKLKEFFYILRNNRNNIIIGITCVLVALISVVAFYKINNKYNTRNDIKEKEEERIIEKEEKKTEKTKELEEEFRVEIKGEVKKPGVYTINSSKRVIDVINKAGGLTKSSDISIINLSKKVKDEMVIIVYSKNEVATFIKNKKIDNTKLEICKQEFLITNDACINANDLNTSKSTDTTSSTYSSKSTSTNSNENSIYKYC